MDSIFFEISAIIIVSTVLALIAKALRQPIILAFMVAGIILGPLGFNVLQSHSLIDVLSTFGISFVLFLIGIELNLKQFKELNRLALVAGFGQVLFTGLIGFTVCLLLGFGRMEAWFIAVALTMSSTIIVVKVLSEKRQLESLYGRITVAILLIQDFIAIIALLVLEGVGASVNAQSVPWAELIILFVKAALIGGTAFVLAKYVFKGIFRYIGNSQELLFLWSIAWCLLFAALALALNFSVAIGVFFAGLALSTLDYNYEIAARIRSLRDFFIVIFFTYLGSQLVLSIDPTLLLTSVILSLFVLVGNPFIVYVILIASGHTKRTALFTGLAVGQISEFSFIIINLGLAQGHLSKEVVSMVAIIGLVTMVLSTYFITYNDKIYRWLQPILKMLPLRASDEEGIDNVPEKMKGHIVLFGYHVTINKILKELTHLHKHVVIVDYNPSNIDEIKKQPVYYIYGDMRDQEILERANLDEASMIISIVPYPEPTMSLLQYIKHFKIKADVVVSANQLFNAERFYEAGATFVLHPESISLDYLKTILKREELAKVSSAHKKELYSLLGGLGKQL